MSRKYSVHEVESLRRVVETKWLFGSYSQGGATQSRTFYGPEKAIAVEELVRTHMLAGHTAEDLIASEQRYSQPEKKT